MKKINTIIEIDESDDSVAANPQEGSFSGILSTKCFKWKLEPAPANY